MDEGTKLDRLLGVWKSTYQATNGSVGGLTIIWNPKKVDIVCLEQGCNWISVNVQSLRSDLKFILVNTYGPNNLAGKKQVWNELSSLFWKYKEARIVIGGDFNSIISLNEKRGGLAQLSRSSLHFLNWIVDQGLIDIPIKNGTFT